MLYQDLLLQLVCKLHIRLILLMVRELEYRDGRECEDGRGGPARGEQRRRPTPVPAAECLKDVPRGLVHHAKLAVLDQHLPASRASLARSSHP